MATKLSKAQTAMLQFLEYGARPDFTLNGNTLTALMKRGLVENYQNGVAHSNWFILTIKGYEALGVKDGYAKLANIYQQSADAYARNYTSYSMEKDGTFLALTAKAEEYRKLAGLE